MLVEIGGAIMLAALASAFGYAWGHGNGKWEGRRESERKADERAIEMARRHQVLMFWQNPERYILEKSRRPSEDMVQVKDRVSKEFEDLDEFDLRDLAEQKGWLADRSIN